MAAEGYITQPSGIGIRRSLRPLDDAAAEHLACVLRVLEQLPMLSEYCDSEAGAEKPDPELLLRQLKVIHQNHLELAKYVRVILD